MSRPQKPADLKDAIGSRHAKPEVERKALEPLMLPDVIPEYLSVKAGAQWRRLVPALVRQGVVFELDRTMLETLCHSLAVLYASDDAAEVRLLAKTISELSDKFNMNPKARAQSGFGGADNGVKTRNF